MILFTRLCVFTRSPSSPPQIEDIVTRIQDEKAGGVSIRTVKSFLSKIPSVVSGWCPYVFWCNAPPPHTHWSRAARVCTRVRSSRAKMTFSALFTLRLPRPEADGAQPPRKRPRGVTLPLSHGRKAAFLSLFVLLCVCRCDYVKLPGGGGTLGAVTSP